MKTLPFSLLSSFSVWFLAFPLFAQDLSTVNYGYNTGKQGYANSFLGAYTGLYTTGSSNSFIGCNAGRKNTLGEKNSFVGTNAGFSNLTGNYNSFLGYQAGYSNTGDRNTFLGSNAGFSSTGGVANCFVGAYAGYSGGGFSNCFLGAYAGQANISGTNNSLVGRDAGYATTTGGYNSMLGYAAGYANTTGSFNLFLGAHSNASANNFSNAGAIGYRAYVTAANALVLGSIKGVNGATADTKVGIRTTAPAYNLHVNGSAAKPGGGAWTVASDKRLKQDISAFTDGLDLVQKIKPVWFKYNGKAGLPTDKKYVGVIAQEMQQIAPYTIGEFTYQDTTGRQEQYLDYDANALTYLLVNAVKEVDQKYTRQLAEQEQQIEVLESKLSEMAVLQERLAKLEALLLLPSNTPNTDPSTAAQLFQNEPNPTAGTTVIRYFVPLETVSAQLKLYSLTGVEVQSLDLTQKGHGQVRLSVGKLAAGGYVYHLFVGGQSMASKKLLLEK